MNILVRIIIALIMTVLSSSIENQDQHAITVVVNGINSNKGKVLLALYNSENEFLKTVYKGKKSDITNNSCQVIFEDVPSGIYAVSIFHDENDNGKMDTNFMGIPKEDYGCSNNAKGFMGPPKWGDANFELNNDQTITITL